MDFNHERIALGVAVTLSHTALAPLARMLGIRGDLDGQIEQASFTFHGALEDPASAQRWLSARATGLRWGERRWQSLETRALVVDRQVRLHRFDLRQAGNHLSLSGEFSLPPADTTGLVWLGEGAWWGRGRVNVQRRRALGRPAGTCRAEQPRRTRYRNSTVPKRS